MNPYPQIRRSRGKTMENEAGGVPAGGADDIERLAPRFHALFAGNERVHGVYNNINEKREDGKLLGTEKRTVFSPVTVALWEEHLAGRSGLGIVPIRGDSTVRFGAIDIDSYADLDHAELARTLARHKLPLLICRSKSGGAHVCCFTSEPVSAANMIARLREVAALLGQGSEVEIFPKQQQVLTERGDAGSWLNMPYFNGLKGMRWAIRGDNNAMESEEFLNHAESLRQGSEFFSKPLIVSEDMPQGPPCLAHLITIGVQPGGRNNALFNFGVYARKLDPDNWEQRLEDMNHQYMDPPLSSDEVLSIKKSLRKRGYGYTCSQSPIAAHCNKAVCQTRKYGIGTGGGWIQLDHLTKVETEPPVYFCTVEGKRLEVTVDELQDPIKFQRKCIQYLDRCPPAPKRDVWYAYIDKVLQNNMDTLPAPSDASADGQVWLLVEKFCNGLSPAKSKSEILLGKPWTDDGRTYFRSADLLAALARNRVSGFDGPRLWNLLRKRGGTHQPNVSLKGVDVNLWSVPEFPRQTEGHDVPESVGDEAACF